ncbi:MAG: accessory factor associated with RNA polymerase II [Thelocarpon impressellum]|nr:MAG: accessory factor associated with RNA polymerase II [Thelocarpon impressellum]
MGPSPAVAQTTKLSSARHEQSLERLRDGSESESKANTASSPAGASNTAGGVAESRKDFYMGNTGLRVAASATKDGRPLSDAKPGFAWKWQGDGSWFERKVTLGRYSRRPVSTGRDRPTTPDSWSTASPGPQSHSSRDITPDAVAEEPESPSKKPSRRRSRRDRSDGARRERESPGLYRRSRKLMSKLGGGSQAKDEDDDSGETRPAPSRTQQLLDQVTHWLQEIFDKQKEAERAPKKLGEASSSRKTFLFPRKDLGDVSRSSSVLELHMGKPPKNTPEPGSLYGVEEYMKVEISDPDGPTFLPSEARRIGTPPLPSGDSGGGRPRGYFFHYGANGGTPGAPWTAQTRSDDDEDMSSGPLQKVPTFTQWCGVGLDDEGSEHHCFEWQVPQHLAGSPLCPASPQHASGGRGVCVYHGRAKNISTY